MSRFYEAEVKFRSKKKISEKLMDKALNAAAVRFWVKSNCEAAPDGKSGSVHGELTLAGGQTECEAHEEIVKAIRKVAGKSIQVYTRWTCLEDLPYDDYYTEGWDNEES